MSTLRKPVMVFPVRDYILDELDDRGLSVSDLRESLPFGEMRLVFDLVMNTEKGVTLGAEMANELAVFFNTSAEFLTNLDNAWQTGGGK